VLHPGQTLEVGAALGQRHAKQVALQVRSEDAQHLRPRQVLVALNLDVGGGGHQKSLIVHQVGTDANPGYDDRCQENKYHNTQDDPPTHAPEQHPHTHRERSATRHILLLRRGLREERFIAVGARIPRRTEAALQRSGRRRTAPMPHRHRFFNVRGLRGERLLRRFQHRRASARLGRPRPSLDRNLHLRIARARPRKNRQAPL
jgi:hypothetical protein